MPGQLPGYPLEGTLYPRVGQYVKPEVGAETGVEAQLGVPLANVGPQTQPIGGYPFAFS